MLIEDGHVQCCAPGGRADLGTRQGQGRCHRGDTRQSGTFGMFRSHHVKRHSRKVEQHMQRHREAQRVFSVICQKLAVIPLEPDQEGPAGPLPV